MALVVKRRKYKPDRYWMTCDCVPVVLAEIHKVVVFYNY